MPTRTAHVTWKGPVLEGTGTIKFGSGTLEQSYSFETRFEDKPDTNPEELIGGAHAGCFSMALSKALGDAGHTPERIRTDADVSIEKANGGFEISGTGGTGEGRLSCIEGARWNPDLA